MHPVSSLEDYFSPFRQNIIGREQFFESPFSLPHFSWGTRERGLLRRAQELGRAARENALQKKGRVRDGGKSCVKGQTRKPNGALEIMRGSNSEQWSRYAIDLGKGYAYAGD